MKQNDLEFNLQGLVESKVVNLDVTLATLVKGGALSGLDPWDIFCGNGWIFRRRGPGPGSRVNAEEIRNVVREEIASAGLAHR